MIGRAEERACVHGFIRATNDFQNCNRRSPLLQVARMAEAAPGPPAPPSKPKAKKQKAVIPEGKHAAIEFFSGIGLRLILLSCRG